MSLRRLVKETQKGKQVQAKEQSSLDEGEEMDIPEDYETIATIPKHIKTFYRHYESMKTHQEEIKDLTDLKISLGYLITKWKGQMEPQTKAQEDRATTRARVVRMEEVT